MFGVVSVRPSVRGLNGVTSFGMKFEEMAAIEISEKTLAAILKLVRKNEKMKF